MTTIEQSAAAMARYVAELEKEVQALRADGLRYRWLREGGGAKSREWPPAVMPSPPWCIRAVRDHGAPMHTFIGGDELDAAIDAAMGGREG